MIGPKWRPEKNMGPCCNLDLKSEREEPWGRETAFGDGRKN